MKNVINYYYNLYPDNIHQTDQGYFFIANDQRYFLTKYQGDINNIKNIYDMHIYMLNNNFYVHPIILNNQNQILTYINNDPYVLMLTIYYKNQININDIISFSSIQIPNNKPLNWGELWSTKNDYLEYQISMLGQNHPLIRESFSYYIGLGENAIQLVNSLKLNNIPLVYAHKRINSNDKQYDLYNPLNITVDFQIRDMAEYLKSLFFNNQDITKELNSYLNNGNLSKEEYLLFLARMIYPTYYYDLYEEIITNRKKDEEIKKITDKVDDYEKIIKQIYNYYKSFMITPQIEWLE